MGVFVVDIKIVGLICLTVVTLAAIAGSAVIGRAAFAENAAELGEDGELMLRISTVFIVVLAGLFFAVFGFLEESIPFLSPIAAFVLGGIKARTK